MRLGEAKQKFQADRLKISAWMHAIAEICPEIFEEDAAEIVVEVVELDGVEVGIESAFETDPSGVSFHLPSKIAQRFCQMVEGLQTYGMEKIEGRRTAPGDLIYFFDTVGHETFESAHQRMHFNSLKSEARRALVSATL